MVKNNFRRRFSDGLANLLFIVRGLAFFGVMVSFMAPASYASTAAADTSQTREVELLFELGYLKAFTINTSESIQEIIADLTENQNDTIFETIVLDTFEPAEMEQVIINSLSRSMRGQLELAEQALVHLSNPEINALMAQLYDNPTDFDDPEIAASFEDFIGLVEANLGIYRERIDLVSDIISRSQTTRITVQTLEDFLTIIVFTLNQTNPEDKRLTDRQVNDLIISLRNNFRELFDNVMLYVSLYSTRDFDMALLQTHADFLATDAGRWFIRSYNTAIMNSFGEVSENVAGNLAVWALEQSEMMDQESEQPE